MTSKRENVESEISTLLDPMNGSLIQPADDVELTASTSLHWRFGGISSFGVQLRCENSDAFKYPGPSRIHCNGQNCEPALCAPDRSDQKALEAAPGCQRLDSPQDPVSFGYIRRVSLGDHRFSTHLLPPSLTRIPASRLWTRGRVTERTPSAPPVWTSMTRYCPETIA